MQVLASWHLERAPIPLAQPCSEWMDFSSDAASPSKPFNPHPPRSIDSSQQVIANTELLHHPIWRAHHGRLRQETSWRSSQPQKKISR